MRYRKGSIDYKGSPIVTDCCDKRANMVLTIKKWAGKVAVVSGASSGIGAAIATYFVKSGLLVSSNFTALF